MANSGESCESRNSDEFVDSGWISEDDEYHNFYKSGDSCLYGDSGDSNEFGDDGEHGEMLISLNQVILVNMASLLIRVDLVIWVFLNLANLMVWHTNIWFYDQEKVNNM